jgi:hypothetical protein
MIAVIVLLFQALVIKILWSQGVDEKVLREDVSPSKRITCTSHVVLVFAGAWIPKNATSSLSDLSIAKSLSYTEIENYFCRHFI